MAALAIACTNNAGPHNGELIPGQSSQSDVFRQRLRKSFVELLEQLIASGVTQRVIDLLEVIQIDRDQQHSGRRRIFVSHGLFEPRLEPHTICQTRQRIMECQK